MQTRADQYVGGNQLLDLITHEDAATSQLIAGHARRMALMSGEVLQRAGHEIAYCYFPLSGVYSLGCPLDDDTHVNVQAVGYDGAVHATLGADLSAATHNVVCNVRGDVIRIDARLWTRFLHSNEPARAIAAVFTDYMLARSQRMTACEMRHDVESRICRALCDIDRWQKGGPLEITHQGLSELLGVRRTTISLIAHALQEAGIIAYKRGLIEIRDRHALQVASCSCDHLNHAWQNMEPDENRATRARDGGVAVAQFRQ